MSMTLEIRGHSSLQWPLSTGCLDDIERLRKRPELTEAINMIFGDLDVQAGTLREVDGGVILKAIERLGKVAKESSGAFEVNLPPLVINGVKIPMSGGRGAGVTINGQPHVISCYDTYWTLQPNDEFLAGKAPEHRHDPAELFDETRGVSVAVTRRQPRESELEKLLRKIRKIANDEVGKTVQIIWG